MKRKKRFPSQHSNSKQPHVQTKEATPAQAVNEINCFEGHAESNDESETNLSDCAELVLKMKEEHTSINWTEKETILLIKAFKKYPILYNPQHRFSKVQEKRDHALADITNQMKKHIALLHVEQVEAKLNELIEQFKNELFIDAHVLDVEATPTWCSYMQFLRPYLSNPTPNNDNPIVPQNRCADLTAFNSTGISPDSQFTHSSSMPQEQVQAATALNAAMYQDHHRESITQAQRQDAITSNSPYNRSDTVMTYISPENIMQVQTDSADDQTFINYIREEMLSVRNDDLKDELRQKITTLIFEYKRKQRTLDRA